MPQYEFVADDGQIVEKSYPMRDAPPIGAEITVDGKVFRRVFCGTVDQAGIDRKTHKYPFVSHALPPYLPGCKHTHTGNNIIRSQRHEREVLARTGYVRE